MKSGARITIGLLGIAVFGALASFFFTVRMGNIGVRGRITQRVQDGPGTLLDLSHEIGFDWDEVFIFGPATPNRVLRERADVPATITWIVNLEARDDVTLLAFTSAGRHRGHIVYPRNQGDFASAVREKSYAKQAAVFEVSAGHPPRLVPVFP